MMIICYFPQNPCPVLCCIARVGQQDTGNDVNSHQNPRLGRKSLRLEEKWFDDINGEVQEWKQLYLLF